MFFKTGLKFQTPQVINSALLQNSIKPRTMVQPKSKTEIPKQVPVPVPVSAPVPMEICKFCHLEFDDKELLGEILSS